MTYLANPFLLAAALAGLALVTAVIFVQDKLGHFERNANARLEDLNLYWHAYHLWELPAEPAARRNLFLRLGRGDGFAAGMGIDGPALAFLGVFTLARWLIYPARKKRALGRLAASGEIPEEELRELATSLR